MKVMYKENSPWNKTPIIDDLILDVLKKRFIYKDPYDEIYTIPQQFNERPDLCSYKFYGTAKYWWIRGFTTGTVIRIPSKDNISKMV